VDISPTEKAILLPSSNLINNTLVTGTSIENSILFKGTGQTISKNNGLNFAILKGNPTTYSGRPYVQVTSAKGIGSELVLVSALQARNQARVIISGSLSMFSNKYAQTSNVDNRLFGIGLTKWVFQERGQLRASNIVISGQTGKKNMFTINDQFKYSVDISERNGSHWIPFISPNVQLEFVMLDPYIRINLVPDNNGKFTTSFQVPDVPGVFSCRLRFQELGYSTIDLKNTTPVRPYRHDQDPRWLEVAYPYYSSSLIILFGTVIFSVLFIISK